MATNKTKTTNANVEDFINNFADSEQKKKDSHALIEIMKEVTGFEPRMYGPSIVGFGNYHYRYKSGHEGDAPLAGFSPRKTAISLYVFTGMKEHEHLLKDLGKFKKGKACIYIKQLSDINLDVLKILMRATINFLHSTYGKN